MSSLTDYLKDWWKTVTKSSEEKKADKESYENVKNEIKDFIDNYDSELPKKEELGEAPTYERMEFDEKSDEEIKSEAESSLKEYYDAGVSKLESEDEAARKQKEQQKLEANNEAVQKQAEIEKAFAVAKEDSKKGSIKQGIARSSIAEKKEDALSTMQNEQVTLTKAELNQRISDIDSEISDLSLKREKALNDFNVAYATKLTTQINALKKEQESKKKEVLKYNNTIEEKEFNDNIKRELKIEEEYKKAIDNYYAIKKEKEDEYYKTIYNKLDNMLSTLTKNEARSLVSSDKYFNDVLNSVWFARLYNKYVNGT